MKSGTPPAAGTVDAATSWKRLRAACRTAVGACPAMAASDGPGTCSAQSAMCAHGAACRRAVLPARPPADYRCLMWADVKCLHSSVLCMALLTTSTCTRSEAICTADYQKSSRSVIIRTKEQKNTVRIAAATSPRSLQEEEEEQMSTGIHRILDVWKRQEGEPPGSSCRRAIQGAHRLCRLTQQAGCKGFWRWVRVSCRSLLAQVPIAR